MYFVQSLKRLMKRTSKYLLLKLAQSTNPFVFRPATKLYPRFCPFFAPKFVFQVQSTLKTQKTRKRRISIKSDKYGLFHLFLLSCIHTINLSPYRYEVGCVFVFEVDLFSHTSKALFFTGLPPFNPFLQ